MEPKAIAKIKTYDKGADSGPFETLELTLEYEAHWQIQGLGTGGSTFTLYKPSDDFLQNLILVAAGELARRTETAQ